MKLARRMENTRCLHYWVTALMATVPLLWSGTASAIPFSAPIGTHIFGQVAGSPVPLEVRFESPIGFSGTFHSDSVSAGGGTAGASASLGRGELRAFAASPTDPLNSEIAHAIASFADQIRITNADGSAITGPVAGAIRMHMGGLLTVDPARSISHGGNDATSRLDLNVAPIVGATHTDTDEAFAALVRGVPAICIVANCVIVDDALLLNVSQDVTVPFLATAAVDVIGFQAFLDVGAANMATADIFNTATLFIDLPGGFTFTSGSGVLLTERAATPVPEPASVLLLASGLAGLIIWRRRQQG